MNEDELSDFSGTVRLFPLPELVVFPHAVQRLHIFEPRYRQMVADALAGDRLIAMATLVAPDNDVVWDRPPIDPVVCVGRIGAHQKFPDGKYNLRLHGIGRARVVQELNSDRLYRTASVDLIRETAPTDLMTLTQLRRDLAAIVLPRFGDDPAVKQQLIELFDGDMPLGQLCDVLSFALPLPTELKLGLLAEAHSGRRAVAIGDAVRVSAARAERPFPPPFSAN